MSARRGGPRGRGRGGPSSVVLRGPAPGQGAAPQHRVFEPGKRHMELIPSVSRSSGLEKDGDALRDPNVQREYWEFIRSKVEDYWKKYPLKAGVPRSGDLHSNSERHRKETEENLLILLRKLREGLLSTQRKDAFAQEVYETSLYLSVLFRSPVQTTSTLTHLFPTFYVQKSIRLSSEKSSSISGSSQPSSDPESKSQPSLPATALSSTVIFLLHHLVSSYPSQLAFHTQLQELHPSLQDLLRAPVDEASGSRRPISSASSASPSPPAEASQPADRDRDQRILSTRDWLLELARCLRRRNYALLDTLTRRAVYSRLVPHRREQAKASADGAAEAAPPDLALEAVGTLVESLLDQARDTTWRVVRTAYREVNLRAVPTGAVEENTTAVWLARSLVLRRMLPRKDRTEPASVMFDVVEAWLDERCAKGEARRKGGEGMEGRWSFMKA
ncbi:hypothetical protein BD414DRAFT_501251 [Trametes punicea]|nr:hypothetical protein BD414DRAFT_501251 [Trametes punicea]